MIPASVARAIDYFQSEKPAEVSREAIMAYATLRAIEHYYPDMLEEPIPRLLEEFSWIKTQEPACATLVSSRRIFLRSAAMTSINAFTIPFGEIDGIPHPFGFAHMCSCN